MEEIKWPKITKDTPMFVLKHIHQQIWEYAIEHGEKPRTPYLNDCAACEHACLECSKCPIIWPGGKCVYHQFSGLYCEWNYSKDEEEKTALAKQIRDLPWKYELEES